MHVGFDGLFLEQPLTGSGQYAAALLDAFARRTDVRVTVLRPAPLDDTWPGPATLPTVTALPPPAARSRRLRKVWWEQVGLPRAAARASVDLVHVPYFAAPLTGRQPLVVTVHDVIPLVLPTYAGGVAMRLYLELARRAVQRARLVLTDSEASRRDILTHLRVPAAAVRTIPLAAAAAMLRPPTAEIDAALARHGLVRPYVVNSGGFDQRKNLPFLIQAFATLARARPDWRLVVIGQPHTNNPRLYPDVAGLVERLGLQQRVILTGFVDEPTKAALYAGAAFGVFPSLYEGFGLTPLEAMACGTAVLAADRSSLPEVVGAAGDLADPTDPVAFAAAMALLMDDPARRARLAEAGLSRAATFSWVATAEATLAAYREVVAGVQGALIPRAAATSRPGGQ